jgi:hypothetical protein
VVPLDGGPSESGLPELPELTNVVATEREDSVGIDFDPVDNAVDYRVYPLPSAADVTVNADGSLTIKNAIYRCAGLRETFDLPNATLPAADAYQDTQNPNQQYSWIAPIPANPTLGYVYATPGKGHVPVYAVGVHPSVNEVGWRESRPKIYTTSATLRETWLGRGARDDGIVFYVPATASSATETVYHSETVQPVGGWTQYTEYYFTEADRAAHAMDSTPPEAAFQVLSAVTEGAKPLKAVLYQPGMNHTELAVGNERFNRAAHQGPGPLWHLEWAGLTTQTTLVVEALSAGCPFQGFLSPQSVDAPPHQPLDTLAQLQKASSTGEVFINGQYDVPGTSFPILLGNGATGGIWSTSDAGSPLVQTPSISPIPIARSFILVNPRPHNPADWDWYEGFNVGTSFGAVVQGKDPANCTCQVAGTPFPCQSGGGGCGYWTSPTLEIGAYELDVPTASNKVVFAQGQFLGQFWDVFDDAYQDVTGFLRLTAPQQATVASDPNKFLHVTWSVTSVSTDRRYPQLIVSDQPSPVQDGFANPDSNFLLIQTKQGPSMILEAEAFHGLVNGKPWAVNNQSPIHALIDYDTWNGTSPGPSSPTSEIIPPADPPFEHVGLDRMTHFDAYISSNLLYVFMDGAPAGCTQYPANGFALGGSVSVSFGDVLYHEAATDELICTQPKPYPFMHEHQCAETKRQWDDLGFKSGVDPPAWDATKFPCVPFCGGVDGGGSVPGGC